MSVNLLNNVRVEEQPQLTVKQMIVQVCTFLTFGVFLGVLSKFSDTIPINYTNGLFFYFISAITTRLGIWVTLATIIAAWSRSPKFAAVKVFAFFVGMLLAYYIYSQMLFGFFPTYYFLRWGGIAILSPLAAYFVWFSRGKGWFAASCAGLPTGLLLAQGYPFFYTFSAVLFFDILTAILLLVILPKQKVQYIKVALMSIFIALIILNSNILGLLFGGL